MGVGIPIALAVCWFRLTHRKSIQKHVSLGDSAISLGDSANGMSKPVAGLLGLHPGG